ncbi:MAG: hypothetical protein AAF602_15910, partial [Myxococcota bacterium]
MAAPSALLGLLAAPVFVSACRNGPEPAGTGDTVESAPELGPCEDAEGQIEGDVANGVRTRPSACGRLELTAVTVTPGAATFEATFDGTGRQIRPTVRATAGVDTVDQVAWAGTFWLDGAAPLEVATWPRQVGDPIVEGRLEGTVRASGAILVGRSDGSWLFVGAVAQQIDELTIEVTAPDQLRLVFGGNDARTVEEGRVLTYDRFVMGVGPDAQGLLTMWQADTIESGSSQPFDGALGIYGPPPNRAAVSAMADADPEKHVQAVLTDGADPTLGGLIRASGRAWMVRGRPFHDDGGPLDPTDPADRARIQRRAEALVAAGVDGAWIEGAATLAEPQPRAASDSSGIAAYRRALAAFRAGFGDRPVVVQGGLPLPSIGVVDAVVPPPDQPVLDQLATASSLASLTPWGLRIGPIPLSTLSDEAFARDLTVALVSGGAWHVGAPPSSDRQRAWLFGPGGLAPLREVAGGASA